MEVVTQRIILDAEAGQVSAGLTRHGIAAEARVHVVVEILGPRSEEPELCSDADLVDRGG